MVVNFKFGVSTSATLAFHLGLPRTAFWPKPSEEMVMTLRSAAARRVLQFSNT